MLTTTKIRLTKGQLSPSSLTVRAYDESSRGVIGTFEAECQLGPISSSILFHILEITTSYNLLLGRAWMHPLGIVPFTVHQKLKLPWKGGVLTILGDGEISAPVCDIKNKNDMRDDQEQVHFEWEFCQARRRLPIQRISRAKRRQAKVLDLLQDSTDLRKQRSSRRQSYCGR